MANTLLLKKSGSTDETPSAGELLHGELAINYADGKLFFKNALGSVAQLLSSPGTGAGQVLFSNGSTMDGDSDFFWDNSNKRLGIGIQSPAYGFHVKGPTGTDGNIVADTTDTSGGSSDGKLGLAKGGTIKWWLMNLSLIHI